MKVFNDLNKVNDIEIQEDKNGDLCLVLDYSEFFIVVEFFSNKTHMYQLVNKLSGDTIGTIKWYGAWRKYCFFPNNDTVWDINCLNDITRLIKDITQQYKDNKNK